jgi:hypothetical protein
LRFVAAAGFPGAAVASGTAPFCSFATVHSVSYFPESEILPFSWRSMLRHEKQNR